MPKNQCDGCNAGQELRGDMHVDSEGKAQMVCQAGRYQSDLFGDVPPAPEPKKSPRKLFAEHFMTADDIMRELKRYDIDETVIDRVDSRLGLRSFVVSGTVWSREDGMRIVNELKGK